ncbi:MAG: N-formylglutamate amidohydrolase [Jannaschia sp.]
MLVRPLLSRDDPDPVLCRPGSSGWLLTVEHAGRAIPAQLGDLGLPPGQIDRHIGWDPGALDLALALAERLDATVVAQRFSRLVIDCNRPWEASDLVPRISDITPVPGNEIDQEDREMRWTEIHAPFHAAVTDALNNGAHSVLSVHSYDPRRAVDGAIRPWPVGLLARRANPLFDALRRHLATIPHVAPLGINHPYEIEDASDYTIPHHAETRGIPHVLIEVRNDFLATETAVASLADMIFAACSTLEFP